MAQGPGSDREKTSPRGANLHRSPADKRARIGEVLRKAYDDALAEPVPEAFSDLLRRLD